MKKYTILALLILLVPATASATGLLIPKNRSLGPLGIKYHRAEVKITDRVAVTKVDQVFINHTNRDLEATYIFPLPKGATVSDFYLYMNGKKQKGEVLEKNRARNIYEGIVRRMKDPGLLEYLGRDLFQARVYPVPRKGEARIEIEFTQVMPYVSGVMKYSYPMRTDRASARTMKDFTMTVNIKSKTPIKSIYSPSHQIYSRKKNDHRATAGFEKTAALLDRDFDLFYTVSEKDIGLNLLTFREPGASRRPAISPTACRRPAAPPSTRP
jgi:Ca-activated chloride channel family protein